MSYEHDDAIRSMIRRATLLATDDTGKQQKMRARGLADEEFKDVVRVQNYGFSSHPPAGAEGLVLALGGRSDRAMFLGMEHPEKRPVGLNEGESILYGPDGRKLHIQGDKILIDAAGKEVVITGATKVTISASTEVVMAMGGSRWNRFRPGRIDLMVKSASEEATPKVMTDAGACANIYARID